MKKIMMMNNNIIKKSLVAFFMASSLCSCNDFLTITPPDKTVSDDFWKNKADVESMVVGAYKDMTSSSIQQSMIIWGAFRSDELEKGGDLLYLSEKINTDITNIYAINLLPDNQYNSWSGFYKVINDCNLVLAHAPAVRNIDPDYTEGDYHNTRAQVLALRSLCYFYLVRAFRDVPYTGDAYESDDQNMQLAQSAPSVVLQHCLDDLKEAEMYALQRGAYGSNNWRNTGYFNKESIEALMADIYLWRASMGHDASDYENCVVCVNKVVHSMDSYYRQNYQSMGDKVPLDGDTCHLLDVDDAMEDIFTTGDSYETLLELKHYAPDNTNTGLEDLYAWGKQNGGTPYMKASQIFGGVEDNANGDDATRLFSSKNDARFWNYCFGVGSANQTSYKVRKMIKDINAANYIKPTSDAVSDGTNYNPTYEEYDNHWILYRLTDVLLMKAEALTELSSGDDDQKLTDAFNIVKLINDRAMAASATDKLRQSEYVGHDKMELLILNERERELCFEGKRWFDLMRFAYRGMTGVDINKTLLDMSADQCPAIYSKMLKVIARKYTSGGQSATNKLKTEPYLYFPVLTREMKSNLLLKQNPAYKDADNTDNY